MTARRRRRLIISGSVVAHAGVLVAFVISGLWKIERLDAAPGESTNFAIVSDPPAESGGPHPKAPAEFVVKPPRVTVTTPTQPDVTPQEPTAQTPPSDTTNIGDGDGSGTGTHGTGTGDDHDKGKCETPPCGGDTKADPPKPQVVLQPVTLTPTVIQGLRISGDTQVRPSDYDKNSMWQQHIDQTSAMFKVCISATGDVSSATRVKSTKYSDYDQRIASAIHGWKYRPYTVAGQPAPACGMVTFVYSIQRP